MSNYMLNPVFKAVFNRNFNSKEFEDRLEMQKIVYLLQNMGISVGDYKFMWYKHGPYSQSLQNDILNIQNTDDINIEFSPDAKKVIKALKDAIFKEKNEYKESVWVECLGSLQYIKENVLPSFKDDIHKGDIDILAELKRRKPYLNNDEDNKMAVQTLAELAIV